MRYVLYKFVEAETAADALAKDASTPVHEVSIKAGEQPSFRSEPVTAMGFYVAPVDDEQGRSGKRR